jgi:cytochrome c553
MNSISTLCPRSIDSVRALARIALCASVLYAGATSIAHADGTGWFTREQVGQGRVAYQANCATCHGDALEGTGAPALAGTSFVAQWNGKMLTDLYAYVYKEMPLGKPDSLVGQQYADIVAFMLAQNGLFMRGRYRTGRRSSPSRPRRPPDGAHGGDALTESHGLSTLRINESSSWAEMSGHDRSHPAGPEYDGH